MSRNYEQMHIIAKNLKDRGLVMKKIPYEEVEVLIDQNRYKKELIFNDGDDQGSYTFPNLDELIEQNIVKLCLETTNE